MISNGALSASHFAQCDVHMEAIPGGVHGLVLVNIHPGGDQTSNCMDSEMACQYFECGKFLDITGLDHIIIGEDPFVSLEREGKL